MSQKKMLSQETKIIVQLLVFKIPTVAFHKELGLHVTWINLKVCMLQCRVGTRLMSYD